MQTNEGVASWGTVGTNGRDDDATSEWPDEVPSEEANDDGGDDDDKRARRRPGDETDERAYELGDERQLKGGDDSEEAAARVEGSPRADGRL